MIGKAVARTVSYKKAGLSVSNPVRFLFSGTRATNAQLSTTIHERDASGPVVDHHTHILYGVHWRLPVVARAHGMYLETEGGRKLLDAIGGAAVSCIGSGTPKVVKAIKDQADKLTCKAPSARSL